MKRYELKVVRVPMVGEGIVDARIGQKFICSRDIFHAFRDRATTLDREEFWVVHLDGKGRMQGTHCVSVGSLNATLVHAREVFKAAIIANAASILLVHNHPSGDPMPSPEDIALTERLKKASEIIGIKIVDHVIVCESKYSSFVDDGRF